MGYESTLIVAEVTGVNYPCRDGKPRSMLSVVATFDLSKMGYNTPFANLLEASPDDPTVYWYPQLASGPVNPDSPPAEQYHLGDCEQVTDPYGKPPKRLDPELTMLALEAADDGYRRIPPALAMLRAFAEQTEDGRWPRLALFHIGH